MRDHEFKESAQGDPERCATCGSKTAHRASGTSAPRRPSTDGEPHEVGYSGPSYAEDWLLETDATAYRVTVVRFVGSAHGTRGASYALVACEIAGGDGKTPRWPVSGGGAFYRFEDGGTHWLSLYYVAEKFRLNDVDAAHVTRLLAAALKRKAGPPDVFRTE